VSFSPDGKRIASGSYDKTIRLWDALTGEELQTLKGHTLGVNSVSFSPDGTRVVELVIHDQTIRLWDASTGEELHTLKGHAGYVTSVNFSPDGTRFVLGTGTGPPASIFDRSGVDLDLPVDLAVYAVSTGEEPHTFKGHTGPVLSVSFSPDGTRIASGSHDQTIRLWDASTGEELQTLKGHTSGVSIVAFSPNGKRIVSGGRDKTLKVWDAPHELVDRQLIDVGTWGKTLSRVLSVEFDVRKTDSLVSPFTGYITVKSEQIPFVNAKGETEFQTEAEARAANRHKPVVTIEDRFRGESGTFHFAYQNNKWVYKYGLLEDELDEKKDKSKKLSGLSHPLRKRDNREGLPTRQYCWRSKLSDQFVIR
jgi:WD40 repeat protein